MLSQILKFKSILIIFSIIAFVLVFGEHVPINIKQFIYTISDILRKILLFSLSFLIFPYLATSISNIKSKLSFLLTGILVLILTSNFTSIMIAYGVGTKIIPLLGIEKLENITMKEELLPLINFNLNPIVDIEVVIIISCLIGIVLNLYKNNIVASFLEKYMNFSSNVFRRFYVPLLPIYVLGNILKLSHEMDIYNLLPLFGNMIIMILITQISYISCLFFVGSGYNVKKMLTSLKNSSFAALVGFSTMSSIVTMPVTIQAAEKNIDDADIARLAINSTVNCHDVGECISLPMIALTLFYLTFSGFPDISVYCVFAFFVALAQFSGVSVPGGSIIIILPFLEKYLSFSPNMLSLIIAISIFMDPVGTANNVMGNSAFAMIIHKIYKKISKLFSNTANSKYLDIDNSQR